MRRLALALSLALAVVAASAACVTPGPHASERPEAEGDKQYVEVDGAWLRVWDLGPKDSDKAPVVLVHGYGSRLEAWKMIAPALAEGRRVIAFDQRGFGLSERPDGAYGPEVHANDLLTLMEKLDVKRPVLIGHSYGGGVALRAALALGEENVGGFGLISSFALSEQVPVSFKWAKYPVMGELLFGAFFKEVPGEKYLLAFHDEERFVTVEALDEMKALMARPGSVYAAMETVRGMRYDDVEGRYGDLNVPGVVVWGENDKVVPLRSGKKLSGAVDRPLVVLSNCGHMPSWERPETLLAALAPVLSQADSLNRGEPRSNESAEPALSDVSSDDAASARDVGEVEEGAQ